MAPATASNWLSFSLSPMEMLSSSSDPHFVSHEGSSAAAASPCYLTDNVYANDWRNPKQVIFRQGVNRSKETQTAAMADESPILTSFHHQVPKLEDFLGDSSSIVRFSDSQTETQDSSLSQIYDHSGTAYLNEHQDLKAVSGFQTFSTNSGSEVDDSASMDRTQLTAIEFPGHSNSATGGALTLGANQSCENNNNKSNKAIVSVELDSSGKIVDTFGQRTSVYRGVTRSNIPSIPSSFSLSFSSFMYISFDVINQVNSLVNVIVFGSHHFGFNMYMASANADTDGRADTKLIYGITAVGERVRPEKGDKPSHMPTKATWMNTAIFSTYGGYDKEEKAARAFDLAALKYWGPTATTNFPTSNYSKELEEMKHVTKQEFIASLRRKSSGFSRGASIYRGVTRHHRQGRWQARIGRVAGNKDLYLGTFATQEEAAEAYDIAAIKFRGVNAVTNFEMNRYDVKAIAGSSLPVSGAAKRRTLSFESEQNPILYQLQQPQCSSNSNNASFAPVQQPISTIPSGFPLDAAAFYQQNHLQAATPMTLMSQPTADQFFLWPPQSY
ncbi:hypothetical protein V6N11_022703 [Hibiscus sabdariffa]|uniref:AP2/ERF domain-containing protein n=1 Tax=Hibiscus sabdariffa TaxID=183260 RepID=A0ABR2TJZ7_9ROSI